MQRVSSWLSRCIAPAAACLAVVATCVGAWSAAAEDRPTGTRTPTEVPAVTAPAQPPAPGSTPAKPPKPTLPGIGTATESVGSPGENESDPKPDVPANTAPTNTDPKPEDGSPPGIGAKP